MADAPPSRNRSKTRAWIHFLYTQHMRNIPDVVLFGMFRYDVRLARTIGFRTEKRIGSFMFKQKFVCEHVDHSKTCHAWYLLFCYRKGRRTIGFQREVCFKHVFSVRKQMMQRPFMYKTDGADAMHRSRISQRRDFANPLAFEPLSP